LIEELKLSAHVDADWAGCRETRRFTTGFVILLNGITVSYGSKKQRTVATSSTEAEYVAAGTAAKKIVWILRLLSSLKKVFDIEAPKSMKLCMDNQGAMSITKDSKHHTRTKHIDVHHHFVRDLVKEGTIVLRYVRFKENAADILTKTLSREAHEAGKIRMRMRVLKPRTQ
jgi:hypothetical protein